MPTPRGNLTRDILWVFENINLDAKPDARLPSGAPSKGARSMLKWVQKSTANADRFYGNVLLRILPKDSEQDRQTRDDEEARPHLKKINDLIGDFEKEEGCQPEASSPGSTPTTPSTGTH